MKTIESRVFPLAELQHLILRHAPADGAPLRALPNVTLMAATAPTQPFLHMCEPTLALVVQGKHRTVIGDKVLECGPRHYLIIPVDLPLETKIIEASRRIPFLAFRLALKPEKIASLLLESGTGPRGHSEMPGIGVCDTTLDLADAIVRLLRLLDTPADIPVLAAAIEREILWRLVNSAHGERVRQIGLADSRTTQIGIAIRRLRKDYADKLSIDELADSVGMSVPSFHRHFRAVTSMTPIQYQKNIRLQVARGRLMLKAEDVAMVGFDVGYDSASQFSREYKRLFGRPPGQDGEILRQRN